MIIFVQLQGSGRHCGMPCKFVVNFRTMVCRVGWLAGIGIKGYHRSGKLKASRADIELTKKLSIGGRILDHNFGSYHYYR